MAGASMNDIKARIKSVESTMQITRAMELVATSKLRRAKENAERTRPFYEALGKAIDGVLSLEAAAESPYLLPRGEGKTLYIVIAGDRGLAGGYNANVFRLGEMLSKDKDALWLPVGKKALEYYSHRKRERLSESFGYAQDVGVGGAMALGRLACESFLSGGCDRVVLVYTRFVSMLTQSAVYEELLPLEREPSSQRLDAMTDCDPDEMLEKMIPYYVGGIIYSALTESLASEQGARRTAMNAANKNAEEMINTLLLKYNRARQAVITQEITEIVSGSEAL